MTKPARRVLLIFLAATALVGPFIGLAILLISGVATSREPATEILVTMGPALLIWLVAAAPVTLPGALIGATLAIHMAKRKARPWTRSRWAVTGAFAGAALASILTATYFGVLGANVLHQGITLQMALLLGLLVGAGTTWTVYRDLESLQKGHAA